MIFDLAKPEQAKEIAALINDAYQTKNLRVSKQEAYRRQDEKGQRTTTEAMFNRIKNQEQYLVCVLIDPDTKKIVGTASLQCHNTYAELFLVCLSPDYWGKNLGKQLMEYAEQQAQEKFSLKEVRLEVLECLPKLQDYYKENGYVFYVNPETKQKMVQVMSSPSFVREKENVNTMVKSINFK